MGAVMICAWLIGMIRFNTGGHFYLVLILAALAVLIRIHKHVERKKIRIMKTGFMILAVTGIMAGLTFTSCERSPQDKMDDAREEVQRERRDVVDENKDVKAAEMDYEQYKSETEMKLRDNETRISDFRTRMNKDRSLRNRYESRINELEKKNMELEDRLRSYKREGNEDWNEFRREFNHDMDELGTALKDIFKDNVADDKTDEDDIIDRSDRDRDRNMK